MPTARVYDEKDNVVGSIVQDCCPSICCKYQLTIYKGGDISDNSLFRRIKRCRLNCHSCCSVGCCGCCGKELDFEVTDSALNTCETITKVHSGCYRECCTGADLYKVELPPNEQDAALLLAAV